MYALLYTWHDLVIIRSETRDRKDCNMKYSEYRRISIQNTIANIGK